MSNFGLIDPIISIWQPKKPAMAMAVAKPYPYGTEYAHPGAWKQYTKC